MLNIVITGAPGSGKGTQSDILVEKYGLKHISTGDLLRGEIAKGSELGMKAKTLIDAGNLVPDEIINGMLESVIKANLDAKGRPSKQSRHTSLRVQRESDDNAEYRRQSRPPH